MRVMIFRKMIKDLEWLWTDRVEHPSDTSWRHVKDGYYIQKKSREFERHICMTVPEGELLAKYSSQAKIGIVEIGRKYGGSTLLIASCSSVPIISIDWNPLETKKTYQKLRENSRVTLIQSDSRTFNVNIKFDVLLVDGMHKYHFIKKEMEVYWPKLTVGGHALFHDHPVPTAQLRSTTSRGTPHVEKAVNELIPVYGELVTRVGTFAVVRKVSEFDV